MPRVCTGIAYPKSIAADNTCLKECILCNGTAHWECVVGACTGDCTSIVYRKCIA